jgi:HD-GYP domain-containing protein (c-di-GMP phosphodiesterase class II)
MSNLGGEQVERQLIRIGKTLVNQIFVLLKTSLNYGEGHAAMNAPAANIFKAVEEIHRRNEAAVLKIRGGHLLLGELRLRPEAAGFDAFMFTLGEMKRHFIGEIHFLPAVTLEEIRTFAYIFGEIEPIPSPQTFRKVLDRMLQRNIAGIKLEKLDEKETVEEKDDSESRDARARAKKVYLQTVHTVAEVMDNVTLGQTLKLRKTKRVVQSMIDQLLAEETNLIGLTTIRCHDEYTYNHSVNVCILSLAIGQRVGLSKAKLCELGMAALFHDIGKADIPKEILNKPGEFTKEEWATMQRHPVHGVRKLMKLKGLDALTSKIVTGAFEHHLNYDFSGYPQVPYKTISLFGKIISVADCYDGMSSSRVYRRTPFPPDKVLKFMISRAGKAYDPILMKLLINCVGIYPIGSLLLLNTQELAVVMQSHSDPDKWNVPRVKLITDRAGNEADEDVDLSDPQSGRTILETIDSQKYKVDVTRYFL